MTRKREVLAGEDISDLPPPSHRHPMSGEPIWDQHAVRAVLSKLRAPVADERAALGWYAEHVAGCRKLGPDGDAARQALDKDGGERARAALASAPVAGYIKPDPAAPTHPRYVSELKYRSAADAEADPEGKGWLKVYAAPQASAEDVRNAALEEAAQALDRLHAENRRWHNEFREAAAAIRALKTQADKDGGQQRNWVSDWSAAIKSLPMGRADAEGIRSSSNACMYRNECRAMLDRLRAAFDHPVFAFLLGEGPLHGVHFGDRHPSERGAYWWRKDLRAALSAAQAEQGERDAALALLKEGNND
ncbi:hypothetical protein ACLQ9J_04325 [Bordetella hinzii]|uniref:hypothetical protein n=1 Tax=Bordetella hinzii TaxID=103855 RepID=UPI0039FCD345